MRFISAVVLVGWLCANYAALVIGDIGTAASYNPPYTPTRCGGNDQNQFPEGDMFVAVSNGLWDNGAACGRRYRIRCIGGFRRPCKGGSDTVEALLEDVAKHVMSQ
ncbi:hypothetical protein Sjap_011193 [Stephania japonica]|uniref:Expansin-like EG45 domain-containing protein n=1 Tax=Stephania japonica TaxID=461633 RepID=A0AAP0P7V7_9MAGN